MRTLGVVEFLSLDGVMQGLGSPDEDRDGGFEYGGWVAPYGDEVLGKKAAEGTTQTTAYLFGRKTYEHMAAYWPTEQAKVNDPAITSRMNDKEKLVFSTTLTDASWSGTTVVRGEATEHVPTIKAAAGKELLVIGAAHLTANLAQAGVLDELRVMVCPIVLGQGRSLFEDLKERVSLKLLRVRQFDSGNLVLTYRPSPHVMTTVTGLLKIN